MTCPHCQSAIADDARFCPACGKETVATQTAATMAPAAATARDLVGREIAGRYRIVEKLGEGGMGAVYRGEQISLKRAVAVKVLKAEMSANAMLLRRFNAEAEAVAKLGHPNTVNIYDFGQDVDGSLFIAMEFIEGRSLRHVVQTETPFAPARALRIAAQIAASITDAHAHDIVHRDLKPDNVMLQTRGRETDIVRVLDFGIAKLRDDSRATQQMTQAGDMLGTPQYMAPEQIKGEVIDGRTDIYALGCILYEMLTARLPFEATTVMALLSKHLLEPVVAPSARRPDLAITPELDRLVLTAMMKPPAARPATMELYGEQIAAALAAIPAGLRATGSAAAVSAQRPAVTPAPTPAPLGATPVVVTPAPVAVAPAPHTTEHVRGDLPRAGHGRSRGLVYLAAVGVLAIAGVVVVASRSSKHADSLSDQGSSHSGSDKPGSDPSPSLSPADDPWSHSASGSAATPVKASPPADAPVKPAPPPVSTDKQSTAEMPLPKGARLSVPPGFVFVPDPSKQSLVYTNAAQGMTIILAPLVGGTNDPTQLAHIWEKTTGAKLMKIGTMVSHGKNRAIGSFTNTVGGVAVGEIIATYIEPKYRVLVLVRAPIAKFGDKQFQAWLESFYLNSVALP